MAAKMCNTINQNIEPCDFKLINRYIKQFGTLLDHANVANDDSNANQFPSLTQEMSEEMNTRENASSRTDYVQPIAVWDRGKQQLQRQQDGTETDMEYLRRLESSIETYLESLPQIDENQKPPTPLYLLNADDAILSDVDIESFDSRSIKLRNTAAVAATTTVMQLSNSPDTVETTSLSNFHNVRDVLLNIHQRLEQYLKSNGSSSSSAPSPSSTTHVSTKLECKIEELKEELQRYVALINEKKENELRKFSENMANHSKLVHMRNAFMKKEINPVSNGSSSSSGSDSSVCIYDIANEDTQKTDSVSYYSNDSISHFDRWRRNGKGNCDGFIMKSCYDECSYVTTTNCCDGNSVQYYSMLINEERGDNLLNDPAPPPLPFLPPRYQERETISLIYRSSDNVIKQWQKYQLNTITIKPKKSNKLVKLNLTREKKQKQRPHSYDLYTFTLDYHKTRLLQMKLEKERKIRFICRMFFYFFGVVCFVLVVVVVQSMFNVRKK